MPLVENETIRSLRLADGGAHGPEFFRIFPGHRAAWRKAHLRRGREWVNGSTTRKIWKGFVVEQTPDGFVAFPKLAEQPAFAQHREQLEIHAATEEQLRERLIHSLPLSMRMTFPALVLVTYLSRGLGQMYLYLRKRLGRMLTASRT